MRGEQTQAHEIELSSRHRSDGSAIVVITSCREELLGIDRDPQSTRKRSLVAVRSSSALASKTSTGWRSMGR